MKTVLKYLLHTKDKKTRAFNFSPGIAPKQCYSVSRRLKPCSNGIAILYIVRWRPEYPDRNQTDCLPHLSFVPRACGVSTTAVLKPVTTIPHQPTILPTNAPLTTENVLDQTSPTKKRKDYFKWNLWLSCELQMKTAFSLNSELS